MSPPTWKGVEQFAAALRANPLTRADTPANARLSLLFNTLLVDDPALQATLDAVVGAMVTAAAAPQARRRWTVAGLLAPAVPAITGRLARSGMSVSESVVAEYISSLDPLVVRDEGEDPVIGWQSGTACSLSMATAIGLLVMLVSGAGAVRMVGDRRVMLRSLFNRLAIGALGYAVIFQPGCWILDPGGGRAPVQRAMARLVGAKLVVVADRGGATAADWLVRRKRGGSDRGKAVGGEAHHPGEDENGSRRDQEPVDERPVQT